MPFYFDSYYFILVLPAVFLALWAQARVKSTFRKYSEQTTHRGLTGADAARAVLRANGVDDVHIERVEGQLTDHYDPRTNVIRLSQSVYDSTSVAAVGVAAHEAGHAAQYAQGYGPMKVRTAIIPATQVGSFLAWPLLFIGMFFNYPSLITMGIVFFGMATLFQLVTLPVEYNASHRAIAALAEGQYLTESELPGAQRTLNAAALTYVAALAVSLAQMLRLLLLFGGRRRD